MKLKPSALFPRVFLTLTFLGAAAATSVAQTLPATLPADPTLATTEELFTRMVTAKSGAGLLAPLGAARDPALLPLFDYLAAHGSPDLQTYAMLSAVRAAKDPARLDLDRLLHTPDYRLADNGLSTLVESAIISTDQLMQVAVNPAWEGPQRILAVTELERRQALSDRKLLKSFLDDKRDGVRAYAAVTLLQSKDEAEAALGLKSLMEFLQKTDVRSAAIQGLLLVRIEKEKITAAIPWVEAIAGDDKADEGLRATAISTLLGLKPEAGAPILAEQIAKQTETIQRIKLGLIAAEYGRFLTPAQIAPLEATKSPLARAVANLARQATAGTDIIPDLEKLLAEGHPIVLNWAALYSLRIAETPRRLRLREALINQSAIVDEQRRDDYERAVLLVRKTAEDPAPEGRVLLAKLLRSDNRAIVEAVTVGLGNSDMVNQSELILPVFEGLTKSPRTVIAANYAALILAREGHKEAVPWLATIVQNGTLNTDASRALAGWYYVKMQGEDQGMLQRVIGGAAASRPSK